MCLPLVHGFCKGGQEKTTIMLSESYLRVAADGYDLDRLTIPKNRVPRWLSQQVSLTSYPMAIAHCRQQRDPRLATLGCI